MITGHLQRRWSAERPPVFDKETRIVCLDIKAEQQTDEQGGVNDGFSYLPVEIDPLADYGHIKSQLIEAGFAQKDEFGLLMNAVDDLLSAATQASTFAKFKEALDTEDLQAFAEFCAFRAECAAAAHEVMSQYEEV